MCIYIYLVIITLNLLEDTIADNMIVYPKEIKPVTRRNSVSSESINPNQLQDQISSVANIPKTPGMNF